VRAEFRFCQKGAFTLWAEFDFHKARISKKRVKIISRLVGALGFGNNLAIQTAKSLTLSAECGYVYPN
jgi:hypothetical protein